MSNLRRCALALSLVWCFSLASPVWGQTDTPTPTETPTHTPTPDVRQVWWLEVTDDVSQAVAFVYSVDGGETMIAMVLLVVIVILVALITIWLVAGKEKGGA